MTMDYSPWVEREIWLFLKVAISLKPERPHPPKMVCMHVASTPTCMIFLGQFQSIKFFDDHGLYSLYSPWSSKNLIDWNWPKKIMQVGVDATCMHTIFGGCGLSGFRDIATFKNSQISLSTHGLVHGHQKI